jgi:hypothetical protein
VIRSLANLLPLFGLLAALAPGQSGTQQRRLASPVSISGVILDPNGHAAADVEVHAGRTTSEIVRTDQHGHFSIRTEVPFIVFRKPGFESKRIRSVNRIEKLSVTLLPAKRQLPACLAKTDYAGLPRGAFCFPKVEGVLIGNAHSNGDSMFRDFFLYRNRQARLRHDCCGYVSSDGLPILGNVWDSVEYQETVYAVARLVILDARGKTNSGARWHFLGRAGEYAAYEGYDRLEPQEAVLLDKVIDGVCIQTIHRPAAE